DAHAERNGCANNAIVLTQEGVLIAGANRVLEAGVVRQRAAANAGEFRGELFRAASRRAVDDAAFSAMGGEPVDELARRIRFRPHCEKQVRTVERTHEY